MIPFLWALGAYLYLASWSGLTVKETALGFLLFPVGIVYRAYRWTTRDLPVIWARRRHA